MPLVYIPDNVYASNDGAPSYHKPRFGFSQPQPSLSPFAFHRNEPSAAFPSAYDHDYDYDYGRSSPFANHNATVPQSFLYNTDPLELHKHQLLAEFARKLDHAYPSLAPPMSSSSHSAAVATAAARQRYLLQQQHQKQEQEQQDLEDARRAATTHARAIEEAEQLCAQIALVERLREKQLLQTRMVERQRVVALAKQQAERERERDRQQMMLERKRQIVSSLDVYILSLTVMNRLLIQPLFFSPPRRSASSSRSRPASRSKPLSSASGFSSNSSSRPPSFR